MAAFWALDIHWASLDYKIKNTFSTTRLSDAKSHHKKNSEWTKITATGRTPRPLQSLTRRVISLDFWDAFGSLVLRGFLDSSGPVTVAPVCCHGTQVTYNKGKGAYSSAYPVCQLLWVPIITVLKLLPQNRQCRRDIAMGGHQIWPTHFWMMPAIDHRIRWQKRADHLDKYPCRCWDDRTSTKVMKSGLHQLCKAKFDNQMQSVPSLLNYLWS